MTDHPVTVLLTTRPLGLADVVARLGLVEADAPRVRELLGYAAAACRVIVERSPSGERYRRSPHPEALLPFFHSGDMR